MAALNPTTKALELDHDVAVSPEIPALESLVDHVLTGTATDSSSPAEDPSPTTSSSSARDLEKQSEPSPSNNPDETDATRTTEKQKSDKSLNTNDNKTETDSDGSVGDGGEGGGDGDKDKQNEIAFDGEELNPWASKYVGIQINYFSVGLIYAGSVSILYPILVIQQGVTTSFISAASNLVTLFWSFKIFFGVLSDCFPIFGLNKKPYIVLGWILCAIMLVVLAGFGKDVTSTNLVLMLTFANLGYVMADVAADGYVVWMAHREPIKKRGGVQSLIYAMREVGRIVVNVIIVLGFSGPNVNCPGYESDPNVPCTTDESVASRNDMFEENPDTWCYMKCGEATFNFGLTIPQYVWIIAAVNLVSLPSYFMLSEEKSERENFGKMMQDFWKVMQRRAVWQVMLYSMISHITFNVYAASKMQANYVWLGLSNLQNQGVNIVESLIFFLGLSLIRKYALNFSWRKLIWIGKLMVTLFQLLYILISLNIWRNAWFYMFTDVSATFIYSLNFMASAFAIVEVSEPGFEAITYSLVTTAGNAVLPLSSVISYQFMAFMPDLNTQEGIAADTPAVRYQFTLLLVLVEVINMTSLLALPLLPRQKEQARELVAKGETSSFWASFTLITGGIFLVYSTIITFMTVAGADTVGCYKILGGAGCSENESSIPVYILIGLCFLYCYGVNFVLTFLPIIQGKEKFGWGMFF